MGRCPLCQGVLTVQPEEDVFPVLPKQKQPRRLAKQLAGLLTVAALAMCTAVNYCFPEHGWWV